jgi:adenylate cyclase
VVKGQEISPADAAKRLGVRYLLGGSVRKAAGRVRIAVHLTDASDGQQIWADRLEDTLEDVFALQDKVALRVAGVVETTIQEIGIRRAARRPTENAGSYDAYLRSISLFLTFRREEMLKAIELLDHAITLDPNFEQALSQSGVYHRLVVEHGWCDDTERYRKRGLELVERALRTGSKDARILGQAAAGLVGLDPSPDRAIVLADQAIALNPASSFVWLVSGTLRLRLGESDVAAAHLETTIRLDPISHLNATARMYLAMARFQQGRFDEALALFRSTSIRIPASHVVLAALYGYLRQPAEAHAALAEFHSLSAGSIERIADLWFRRPEHRKLLLDGLAFAEQEAAPTAG